jgi:dTDP-4-dehydrorhamnose 3,5-epimerase
MEVIKTKFKDLYIIKPRIFEDDRGHFLETFNHREFSEKTGLNLTDRLFVQDNESESKLGVLRGLHYQEGAYAQDKLVRVVEGQVLDVVVDMRPDSDTFGKHFSIMLGGDSKTQLYVPKGFAHGFITLTPKAIFSYKCTNYYNSEFDGGVHPFDPTLNIDWVLSKDKTILSDKDEKLPTFDEVIKNK